MSSEAAGRAPTEGLRFGLDGLDEGVVLERLRAREASLQGDAERHAAIARHRLVVPLEQDEGDEELFEAYRRLARSWNLTGAAPIESHRRWLGPWIVRAKRGVHRLIAFEIEPIFEQQSRFNRAVLDLIGLLLTEIGRLRRRVRELESTDRRDP